MSKKLIFLHIPKSAGTSQRTILYDLYGVENSFWYGMDTEMHSNEFNADEIAHALLVGGHKGVNFYPLNFDGLYCSLVREPVSRVVSLFRHYTRPEEGPSNQSEARRALRDLWLDKGIDPGSIVNSINNCSEFRYEAENSQCRFLSRYDPTFSGVMRTLLESDFIVGTSHKAGVFNKYLSDLLGWGAVPDRRMNSNRKGHHETILSRRGAVGLIQSLVGEDIKLYDYINDDCDALFSNIKDLEAIKSSLSVTHGFTDTIDADTLVKINTYCKGYLGIDKRGYGSTGICIVNNSDKEIGGTYSPELEIYYELYDQQQRYLGTGSSAQKLPGSIPAGAFIELSMPIEIDEGIRDRVSYIAVGLQNPGHFRLSDRHALHNAAAKVFNLDD